MAVNTKPSVKLCKNVAKARKVHTSLSIAMYLCLIIGITNPLFLIVSTALVSYLYINKNAKQRMYVSTAAYNLQALKLDKAKNFFEKAKNIFDNELVQELENDINNAENILD
jgi:anti-sigma28 factor (negative regulator of flagellin synthesis)